jgi:phage shock protein C
MSTPYPPTPPPAQPSAQPPVPPKRLMRSSQDKMVAGVCGGLALYLGVDPTLVRVGAVIALVVGLPATALAYVVAWAIMPVA